MPAAASDKLRKSYSFLQKSLNGNINDSDTTITLNNVTNIPTDTAVDCIIDRVDSNGNRTNSLREIVSGVVSGSTLINCTRGLHGTTAQSHTSGAVVEFIASGKAWNDMVDWGLAEHNQDGTHGAVTATSVATDTITEDTAAAGVTIDGVLLKDSKVNGSYITDDTVTDTQLDYPRWWQEIGRTTLGSAADSITVSAFPARKHLLLILTCQDTGGTINATIRFNSDSGNNYADRYSINGAADSTGTSTSAGLFHSGTGAWPFQVVAYVYNIASDEKVVDFKATGASTAGAANAPVRIEGLVKWANTSDQITTVTVINGGTGDYATGSELIVLGHD